jgi:NADH-quinone oxidoreductase subunit N
VPKISFSFVLFFIYSFTFSALSYLLVDILMFSALSSISLGILYALYQTKIKRLIAYSAITHVGYILFALFQGSVEGFQALFIYFFIYIMTSFNLFCLLLIFRQSKTFYKLRKLVDFSFLLKSNYILSVMFVFILLSLAGIPPLAGFFGKFMVFLSVIQFNNYFVLFFLVLCTAASAIYYLS